MGKIGKDVNGQILCKQGHPETGRILLNFSCQHLNFQFHLTIEIQWATIMASELLRHS